MKQEVLKQMDWKDVCEIVETAFGMVGKNVNEELMGRYDSPAEFYEKLLEELKNE